MNLPALPGWARARWLPIVLVAAGLAVLALRSGSATAPLSRLRGAEPGWLLLAVLAQAASLLSYALIVHGLLRASAVKARLSTLVRATLGGIAMGASLPGGQVASAAYWYRLLRKEGADTGRATFAMVGSMLAGVLSLAGLLVVGVAIAGGHGPLAGVRIPILAGCAASVVVVVAGRRAVGPLLRPLSHSRLAGLRGLVSLDRSSLLAVGGLALANWLLDCGSLWASLAAVHAHVEPQSILLTYALAQLVAAVPLLPGGGGTVEATLVVTFAAFGHQSGSVIGGVLLFRVISCWGLVPVGWAAVALRRPTLHLPAAFHHVPRFAARPA
jgi:putative heme transporter